MDVLVDLEENEIIISKMGNRFVPTAFDRFF